MNRCQAACRRTGPKERQGIFDVAEHRDAEVDLIEQLPAGFQLREIPGGRTRLVITGYQTFRPQWVERYIASWLLISVSWPMQARMMTVLKRNIERTQQGRQENTPGQVTDNWSAMLQSFPLRRRTGR